MSDDNIVSFKKGAILFKEGDMVAHFYIIKSGVVRLFKEVDNSIETVSVLTENDFVGEVEFFTDGARLTSAVTMTPVDMIAIKRSEVKKVVQLCPSWVNDIMSTLSERYSESMSILLEHKIFDSTHDEDLETKEKVTIFKKLQERQVK